MCDVSVCIYVCTYTYTDMYLHTFCSSCGPTERISHSANFSRATREAAKSKLKTAAAATGAEQRQRHIDWVPTYVHTHTHARAHDDQRAMPAKESDKEREWRAVESATLWHVREVTLE